MENISTLVVFERSIVTTSNTWNNILMVKLITGLMIQPRETKTE